MMPLVHPRWAKRHEGQQASRKGQRRALRRKAILVGVSEGFEGDNELQAHRDVERIKELLIRE
jgi:hypothetical protein